MASGHSIASRSTKPLGNDSFIAFPPFAHP
jgi:hypothetical protein